MPPPRRTPPSRVGLLTFPSYRWRPAGSFPHKRPPAASAQAHARRGSRFSEGAPSFMRGKERLRVFCVPMLCIGKRSGKARPIKIMRFSAGPCRRRSARAHARFGLRFTEGAPSFMRGTGRLSAPEKRAPLKKCALALGRPRRLFSPLPQVVAVSLRRKCSSGLSRITRKT